MTKDEMKNRISMALRDPVLQQGFEIICKENAELEEKIRVLLSCKNCPENKGGYICQKEYENKCLAQKIEYIKELQQENAELKSGCGMCYRKDKEQLTKAKEIIKELLRAVESSYSVLNWQRPPIKAEAEQFISEVEK